MLLTSAATVMSDVSALQLGRDLLVHLLAVLFILWCHHAVRVGFAILAEEDHGALADVLATTRKDRQQGTRRAQGGRMPARAPLGAARALPDWGRLRWSG